MDDHHLVALASAAAGVTAPTGLGPGRDAAPGTTAVDSEMLLDFSPLAALQSLGTPPSHGSMHGIDGGSGLHAHALPHHLTFHLLHPPPASAWPLDHDGDGGDAHLPSGGLSTDSEDSDSAYVGTAHSDDAGTAGGDSSVGGGASGSAHVAEMAAASMPAASAHEGSGGDRGRAGTTKKARSPYMLKSPQQLKALQAVFAHNPRPPREEIEKLAQSISLTVKETLRWFRDERFRSSKRQQQPARVFTVGDPSSTSPAKRVRRDPAARRPSGSVPAAAAAAVGADRRDLPTRTPSDMGASALAAMAAAARAPGASAMAAAPTEPRYGLVPEPSSRAPSDGLPAKMDRSQRAQMAQTCIDCFAALPPGSAARETALHGILQLLDNSERDYVLASCEPAWARKDAAEQLSTGALQQRSRRGAAWTELERRFCDPSAVGTLAHDESADGTRAADAKLDDNMVLGLTTMFRPHRDYLIRVAEELAVPLQRSNSDLRPPKRLVVRARARANGVSQLSHLLTYSLRPATVRRWRRHQKHSPRGPADAPMQGGQHEPDRLPVVDMSSAANALGRSLDPYLPQGTADAADGMPPLEPGSAMAHPIPGAIRSRHASSDLYDESIVAELADAVAGRA